MGTNSWWIKTDYWVQTVLGCCILASAATVVGISLAFILLLFFGIWQCISGFTSAINGDRLQQIYLFVTIVYFIFFSAIHIMITMPIALIIGIWKYTVTRADYICLAIVDTPQIDTTDLLDA